MEFIEYRCLESLIDEGEYFIATEGIVEAAKNVLSGILKGIRSIMDKIIAGLTAIWNKLKGIMPKKITEKIDRRIIWNNLSKFLNIFNGLESKIGANSGNMNAVFYKGRSENSNNQEAIMAVQRSTEELEQYMKANTETGNNLLKQLPAQIPMGQKERDNLVDFFGKRIIQYKKIQEFFTRDQQSLEKVSQSPMIANNQALQTFVSEKRKSLSVTLNAANLELSWATQINPKLTNAIIIAEAA